ncbi:MAG: isoprenylcysteine carboxylmethyltransferase family protein [Vicinamibacterales bacterium]
MPEAGVARYAGSVRVAWAGAALFGCSLLVAVHSYTIGFDRLTPHLSPIAAIAWNTALFSAFALHHSLFARLGVKAAVARRFRPELERSIYTWVASLLFLAVCLWWQPIDVTLYALAQPWRTAAYGVQLAGVVLSFRSSATLDALDLAGVRQVQRARDGAPPRHVPLKTDGVYGFVRHPLYFAWVLMVVAAPTMTGTRLVFAILSTGYLAIAIPWEERGLVKSFGPEYDAYRRAVRWRMLPGLY